MKKIIAVLLLICLCVGMCACNAGKKEETAPAGPTDEDLKEAVELIKFAHDDIVSISTILLDEWSLYSWFEDYFDEEYNGSDEDLVMVHEHRASAKDALSEAKAKMGTDGTGDYYNAVKEYYKTVKVFWDFVSTYPEGYSELTFSNTLTEYKTNCANAYAELGFYS